MDSLPTIIGKYRLLAELGHGGMAKVFLAVAHGPDGFSKLVVLKTIRVHLVDDPDTLTMFIDEARIAGRLNHPNVVHTLEVAKIDGHHVMVMEYLDGQPLASILRRARLMHGGGPLNIYLQCLADALHGLHYAHELKDFDGTPLSLVHRDISPQNIFVTYDGQIKLLDFGIAKAVTSSSETRAGVIKGKIAYMAPEQFLGEMSDRRSDIYAMGAILWHVAVGARLWRGMIDGQIIHNVVAGKVPSPETVNAGVNPELARITMKALARQPDDRYQTCVELLADVEALIGQLGAVSGREIGAFTHGLFPEERDEISKLVESQLSRARAFNTSEFRQANVPAIRSATKRSAFMYSDSSGQFLVATGSRQPGDTLASIDSTRAPASFRSGSGIESGNSPMSTQGGSNAATSNPIAPPSKQSSARKVFGSLAIAAAVLAVVGYAWRMAVSTKAVPETASSTASQMVDLSVPGSAGGMIERSDILFEIKVEPDEARVFFNDVEIPERPARRQVPGDGKTHRIRVQAPDFDTREIEVQAHKDTVVTIVLDRTRPTDPGASAPRVPGTKPSTARIPPSATTPATTSAATPATTPATPATEPSKKDPSPRDRIQTLDTSNPWQQ